MQTKTATKDFPRGTTTATMILEMNGFYRVTVIHRFDSGNFVKDCDARNLSQVAAEGLLAFYTL